MISLLNNGKKVEIRWKKQTKLSLADILTQLIATEDGVVEFERSEISVVDDHYFKIPYFFDQAKVNCLCGYDGVRGYFGITEEKVVWVNNHTGVSALAFEGTVLDNISIVFEKESFTLECDNLIRFTDPEFYEDKKTDMGADFIDRVIVQLANERKLNLKYNLLDHKRMWIKKLEEDLGQLESLGYNKTSTVYKKELAILESSV